MNEYPLGRFNFRLSYRNVGRDRGLAIQLFGPTDGQIEEVLRFDCFEIGPHYHLAPSYRGDPVIPIDAEEPFLWAIGELRTRVNELLSRAAAHPMNESELIQLESVLDSIQRKGVLR